jgi:hypothetical protein
MASRELQESWRRTTAILRDARSHLSQVADGICADEIAEFEHYLDHNELELALDSLEAAVLKSPSENLRVIELLLSAAESMSLDSHTARFQAEIDRVRREMEERWKRDTGA